MPQQGEFSIPPGAGGRGVGEELSTQLHDAQARILELERQRQQLEAQQRELEELRQKQREMEDGRKDIMELLGRSLKVLERAEDTARREVEQIQQTRAAFTENLEALEDIKPDDWDRERLHGELASALGTVDQARAVFKQSRAKLRVLRDEEVPVDEEDLPDDGSSPVRGPAAAEPADFGSLLLRGFASNFSLFLLGLIALVAYLLKH